ncbi:AAA family ATPase [Natronoglycomyces albus]|uniref:Nuclease SbcCD subunit C n=1 Tax=Natronoglycomyces albus TaxID=2811108 RepID=A0A895XMJ6_9ACTN|nr:SMC family ATPase [Natronoglycomyces albus]QSB06347.1 SMC family ATPase [Natronoglycomyces albus]
MRPIRLDVEGFGSYNRSVTLDFTGVDFFALTGATGAGKSTVLDAMCFALYGKTPRWAEGKVQSLLALSAAEGRVRFVFSAGNTQYVATRRLRRDKHGAVKTSHAAAEKLPDSVNAMDDTELAESLGTSLATGPTAVSEAMARVIGLPFDQFTKSVLLPQGEFAQFLHAKAAERRKILENLLGHTIYGDIQRAAGARRTKAETVATTLSAQLGKIPLVSDTELDQAIDRAARLEQMTLSLRSDAAALDALSGELSAARASVSQIEQTISRLTYIKAPAEVPDISDQAAEAAAQVAKARQEVELAEADETALRQSLADLDLTTIEGQLNAWRQLDECEKNLAKGTELTEAKRQEFEAADELCTAAKEELDIARQHWNKLQHDDLASTFREELAVGQPCPVCDQTVAVLPDRDISSEHKAAREAVNIAKLEYEEAKSNADELRVTLHKYEAQLEVRRDEKKALRARLKGAPKIPTLEKRRADAEVNQKKLTGAAARVQAARNGLKGAEQTRQRVDKQLQQAWREFHQARDHVAPFSPPSHHAEDLALSWNTLVDWAKQQLSEAQSGLDRARQTLANHEHEARKLQAGLHQKLSEVDVSSPAVGPGGDYLTAHASALASAQATCEKLRTARTQRAELDADRAKHEREAEVAKDLAAHLQAGRFMDWLLTEALTELVAGATEILHQITRGQYDLIYRDKEFWVIDHHDADLQRPARSLSGGETFAASLALALALSEQLAGLSQAGAHLDSILLDEGFGTLDPDSLDQVATTLEALTLTRNRQVGVVTHVAALAERVPVRFHVAKDMNGSSVERIAN